MAKLFKKVEKLVNSSTGRLNKTLVQYNLSTMTEDEARIKGVIFHLSWLGYFSNQYETALKEDESRQKKKQLYDFIQTQRDD